MLAGIYRHYKGGLYQVLGVAEHTETEERVVVYVSLTGADQKGPRMRVRPQRGPEGFEEAVKVKDGFVRRFDYIGTEIK